MSWVRNGNTTVGGLTVAGTAGLNVTGGNTNLISLTLPTGAGADKILTSDASGNASWNTSTGVTGTGTDNQIVRWDDTNALQGSLVTIDDSGNILPNASSTQNLGSSSLRWKDAIIGRALTQASGVRRFATNFSSTITNSTNYKIGEFQFSGTSQHILCVGYVYSASGSSFNKADFHIQMRTYSGTAMSFKWDYKLNNTNVGSITPTLWHEDGQRRVILGFINVSTSQSGGWVLVNHDRDDYDNYTNETGLVTFSTTGLTQINPGTYDLRFNHSVVIGSTVTPDNTLHVHKGSAGTVTSNGNSPLVVENSTNAYLSVLVPDANESGILFGGPKSNASGGIIYTSGNVMQFRTHNNSTKMTLDSNGVFAVDTDTFTVDAVTNICKYKVPYGFAYKSPGSQSIANNTWTKMTMDTSTVYGGVTFASSEFTVPITGIYHVTYAHGEWGGNSTGIRVSGIRVNNVEPLYATHRYDSTGASVIVHSSAAMISLTAGDTVSVWLYHNIDGGGNLSVTSTTQNRSFLSVSLVST